MRNGVFKITGGIILAMMLAVALFAPLLAPYDPYEQTGQPFEKPGRAHLLGTNDVGQDIFSELVYGTRMSLAVGVLSAAISLAVGTTVGLLSGWYGGVVDRWLSKVTTFFMTIPFLPAVIVLSAFAGGGVWSMSAILGLLSWTGTARVLRGSTMRLKNSGYIRVARAMGAGDAYLLTRHVLRQLLPLLGYRAVTRVKSGILAESTMSFLGLGNPLAKSWGSMIYYAQAKNALLTGAWVWWIVPPGLCICAVSLALMLLACAMEQENREAMQV